MKYPELKQIPRHRMPWPAILLALVAGLSVAPVSAMRHPTQPAEVTGTITGLSTITNPNTIQLTTDHGTAVTLSVPNTTTIRLNGQRTVLTSLMLGDHLEATYRAADKIAITLSALTPQPNVVS